MNKINHISLATKSTKGKSTNVTHDYQDFIIDGKSFDEYLPADDRNRYVTHIGWGPSKESDSDVIATFTNKKQSGLKNDRILVYGCPVDQDPLCGAVTADLIETDDEIIWKNFKYEVQYLDPTEKNDLTQIPEFRFVKAEYLKVFSDYCML